MTPREQVRLRAALLLDQGATEPVVKLSDVEAVALATELGDGLRHGAKALAAAEALAAALAEPRPEDDNAVEEWARERARARAAFWAEFEGEPIDGATISRKGA